MRYVLAPALAWVLLVTGCTWLAYHKPTDAEKAKAVAVARCIASVEHDGAGGAP